MKSSCVIVFAVASLWCEVSGLRHRRSPAASGSFAGLNSDGTHYGGTFDPTSQQSHQQQFSQILDHNRAFMNNVRDQLAASQRALALAAQGNGGYQDPASFGYNAGFPQGGFQQAGYEGGGSNPQAAFASASIDPTGTQQIASISPSNPNSPNVDVHGLAPSRGGGDGNFYEVSSSSFSSSSNVNGKPTSQRTSHTFINDNGKITEHNVST